MGMVVASVDVILGFVVNGDNGDNGDNNGDVVLDPNNSKLLFLRYTRSKIAIRDNATIMLVIMLVDDIELEFFEFCFINILFYSILFLYN